MVDLPVTTCNSSSWMGWSKVSGYYWCCTSQNGICSMLALLMLLIKIDICAHSFGIFGVRILPTIRSSDLTAEHRYCAIVMVVLQFVA